MWDSGLNDLLCELHKVNFGM